MFTILPFGSKINTRSLMAMLKIMGEYIDAIGRLRSREPRPRNHQCQKGLSKLFV